ncbi:hypothetical protein SNE40_007633 [Patella caerulea]|uniref:Uncharacterized protein n=1 Tax=Patella caerulea TaxID=87958 RepID=A0AAN8JU44_PATCE
MAKTAAERQLKRREKLKSSVNRVDYETHKRIDRERKKKARRTMGTKQLSDLRKRNRLAVRNHRMGNANEEIVDGNGTVNGTCYNNGFTRQSQIKSYEGSTPKSKEKSIFS